MLVEKHGDIGVTGIIEHSEVALLSGNITALEPGKSNSVELTIDKNSYIVTKTNDVLITNENIPSESEILITYAMKLPLNKLLLTKGNNYNLEPSVTTTPTGYENIFKDSIKWSSNDENIAIVDNNGTITGLNNGETTISATLINQTEDILIIVETTFIKFIFLFTVLSLLALAVILLSIFA